MVNLHANFKVSFRGKSFLYNVESEAQLIVLCGISGQGKSTFINALVGTEKISGFIKVDDMIWTDTDVGFNLSIENRSLAWVPQAHLLLPHLNAYENLKLGFLDTWQEDLDKIISYFELEEFQNRMPNRLSGGERQRIAIGRALLGTLRFSRGGVLLLDEPYASLDKKRVEGISKFVMDWCIDKGVLPIYSVHSFDRIGNYSRINNEDIDSFVLETKGTRTEMVQIALPSTHKVV